LRLIAEIGVISPHFRSLRPPAHPVKAGQEKSLHLNAVDCM
jgi:hypothetical protein